MTTMTEGISREVCLRLHSQLADGTLKDGDTVDLGYGLLSPQERDNVLSELSGVTQVSESSDSPTRFKLVWYKSQDKVVIYTIGV